MARENVWLAATASEGRVMPTDSTGLYRLADDGCPNGETGDTAVHDLSELWAALGKDDRAGG